MTLQVSITSLAFLVGLLAAATYFDFRYHRIPNALTFGGALAGLVFVVQADPSGRTLVLSAAGAALGLLIFLPLYALGKMGAGDVKLLAMVGVFVGPAGVFWAAMYSLICGGALALLWLMGAWGVREMAFRTLGTLTLMHVPGARPAPDGAKNDTSSPLKSKMPYAAAISLGAVVAARIQLA